MGDKDTDKGKPKGGRPEGSKNKPKSIDKLLQEIGDRASSEGKTFTHSFGVPDDEESKRIVSRKSTLTDGDLSVFEVDTEEDDTGEDTHTCGNCQTQLETEVSECPHCGVDLSW